MIEQQERTKLIEFLCQNCSEFLEVDKRKKGHKYTCACAHEQIIPLQGKLEIGNIIDEHLITEEIEHFANTTSFRGTHLFLKRDVIIKTIHSKVSLDETTQQLQASAQFKHPNIVPVYSAGNSHGICFIIMQYIDGCDLN